MGLKFFRSEQNLGITLSLPKFGESFKQPPQPQRTGFDKFSTAGLKNFTYIFTEIGHKKVVNS